MKTVLLLLHHLCVCNLKCVGCVKVVCSILFIFHSGKQRVFTMLTENFGFHGSTQTEKSLLCVVRSCMHPDFPPFLLDLASKPVQSSNH